MASRSQVAVIGPPEHMDLPLWREVLSGWELVRLKTSRVYYGCGVPRGDKSAVVVVPGFLGADIYLTELHFWLRRMGYKPYFSRIGHNAQCPDVLLHRLIKTVNRAYADTGKPVHLIGHSFGGVLSRAVSRRHPDRVASVITLGSPFRGVRVNPWIVTAMKRVRQAQYLRGRKGKDCFTETCACGFLCTMRDDFPLSVRHTNIYTKTDGVVDWHICQEDNAQVDAEVSGTHVGLVWNPEVYKIVSERLAAPLAEGQPKRRPAATPLADAKPKRTATRKKAAAKAPSAKTKGPAAKKSRATRPKTARPASAKATARKSEAPRKTSSTGKKRVARERVTS